MLFFTLFIVLISASLASFYLFVAGMPFWLVVLMVLPGALLTAVVVGGQKNENS